MNWGALVAAEIDRLAAVCDGADPARPVPTCDEWTLADLQQHAGAVYRWAATMVRDRSEVRLPRDEMDWAVPASPDGLPDWLRAGTGFVVETFAAADPDAPMWAWGWPKTTAFWPRRMVHELGVHRADAELALGRTPTFDPDVAADGIGELLDNLPHAEYFAPDVARLRGDGEVLALVAPGAAWRIQLLADRFEWSTAPAADPRATTTVSAPSAGDLLLILYGRPAPHDVTGDADLWQTWRTNSAT